MNFSLSFCFSFFFLFLFHFGVFLFCNFWDFWNLLFGIALRCLFGIHGNFVNNQLHGINKYMSIWTQRVHVVLLLLLLLLLLFGFSSLFISYFSQVFFAFVLLTGSATFWQSFLFSVCCALFFVSFTFHFVVVVIVVFVTLSHWVCFVYGFSLFSFLIFLVDSKICLTLFDDLFTNSFLFFSLVSLVLVVCLLPLLLFIILVL